MRDPVDSNSRSVRVNKATMCAAPRIRRVSRLPRFGALELAALVSIAAASGGCALLELLLGGGTTTPPSESIGLQLVAEGLVAPVGAVAAGDGSGRLFVIDQVGRIRVISATGALLETPFLDLTDRMVAVGIDFGGGFVYDERGLLGLAFHPQYASNGRFYVYYSAPRSGGVPAEFDHESHISEFQVSAGDANAADPASERIILSVPQPQFNHNGGQLAFGPDGFLYIALGDGGEANDVGFGHNPDIGNAQDRMTLLGKLLRIDVDGGVPYAIPADNPFVGDAAALPEIYADGFRNPYRFSFDTGSQPARLVVADVGQDLFEEVNLVTSGGNYGWRIREALQCFDPDQSTSPPATCALNSADGRPLTDPILEYPHTADADDPRGIAVVGGFVYRGALLPDFTGRYIFGDFSTSFVVADGSLFVATEAVNGSWTLTLLGVAGSTSGRLGRFVLGFGQDEAGELYLLSSANLGPVGTTGTVHRLVAASP